MVDRGVLSALHFSLFLALFLVAGVTQKVSGDIVGCGGFLKSEVPIDFSKVFIKLYTKQGTLKESSDCAPTNGYYFIPIYDKGEYTLKLEAPAGWYFEPEKVSLNFDGVNDPCSRASDINFVFNGFAVNGKVTSKGTQDGPDGISVSLITESDNRVKYNAKTGENGAYEFKPVSPGNYLIRADDDRYKFTKDSVRIVVKNGNVNVPTDSVVVAGYDVTGQVLFNGEPIKGAHLILFGNDEKSRRIVTPNCATTQLPDFKHKNFICHVTSNEVGAFKFSPLPPGNYNIRPHYVKFDVQPEVMNFEVRHGHAQLPEKFLVMGFGVSGRVMTSPNGKGIHKAEVYLNGDLVTTTDADGRYNLDSMEPGSYRLQIQSDALRFDEVNVRLTPIKPEIDPIYPSEFQVCGRVTPSGDDAPRSVEIRDVTRPSDVTEAEASRETGAFCHFLRPGTYIISVKTTDHERSRGLQYLPPTREVKVTAGPINNIDFSQLRGRVTGRIIKLSPNEPIKGGDIIVKLKSESGVTAMKTLERGDNSYVFTDVMPGYYTVEIHSNRWCFKQPETSVSVASSETQVPDFVQSGFKVTIVSSHDTRAYLRELKSTTQKELSLTRGENVVCLPSSTNYEIEPFGCHGFEKELYVHNANKDDVLRLHAVSHEVTGFVASSNQVEDLVVSVEHENGQTVKLGPLRGVSDGRSYIYKFSYKTRENQILKFVPSSENILFQPEWIEYRTESDCRDNAVRFDGERGVIVEGGIEPPLANVRVTLRVTGAQTNDSDLTTVTKSDGRYKFGPLKNDVRYELSAEKESYVFTGPDRRGIFAAHKLAEINVKVLDNSTKEPLQGVLLSLTGGEKYRKNSMTSEDGALTFHSLSPGEYFLRPMMKEYKFEPSSQIIQIKEGVTERIELKGRRVSFSAYGVVTSLNGEAEANVLIEAVGIEACSNLQEETLSESTGQFRIRGLLPQCEYNIRLKADSPVNAHIHRINPQDLIVRTNQGDIRDIKLIAFELVEHMDLSVHVESTVPEHLKTLRLKLCKEESPESPVHVVKLDALAGGVKHWGNAPTQERFLRAGLLVQLPFVHRDKTPYFIQLDSTLNKHTYSYKEPVVHFIADKTYRTFKIVFDPVPKVIDHEFSNTNYLVIPVVVFIALAYTYSDCMLLTVQAVYGKINENSFALAYQERVPSYQQESVINDVTIEPVAVPTKRKTKPRKT